MNLLHIGKVVSRLYMITQNYITQKRKKER